MLLVTQDADRLFASELNRWQQQETSTRCIVLKLSGILHKPDDWATRIAEAAEHCLGSDGRIYFHGGGDITVLVRNATRKDFTRLTGLISARLAPASLEGLAFLYELPMDGETVAALFTREGESTVELLDASSKSAAATNDLFNPALVRTIGLRRNKRTAADILVVEDDAFLQRLVSNLFATEFRVMAARCGADAIDLYIQQAPDVTFLDIGLPDVSGHDILASLDSHAPPLSTSFCPNATKMACFRQCH